MVNLFFLSTGHSLLFWECSFYHWRDISELIFFLIQGVNRNYRWCTLVPKSISRKILEQPRLVLITGFLWQSNFVSCCTFHYCPSPFLQSQSAHFGFRTTFERGCSEGAYSFGVQCSSNLLPCLHTTVWLMKHVLVQFWNTFTCLMGSTNS